MHLFFPHKRSPTDLPFAGGETTGKPQTFLLCRSPEHPAERLGYIEPSTTRNPLSNKLIYDYFHVKLIVYTTHYTILRYL